MSVTDKELANEQIERIQRLVEGRNDLVWGSFQYRCTKCGRIEHIYLGVGVEGPRLLRDGNAYIPSPFMGPACRACGSYETSHVNWGLDATFEKPTRPPPGARMFKFPNPFTEENRKHFRSSAFCGDTIVVPQPDRG